MRKTLFIGAVGMLLLFAVFSQPVLAQMPFEISCEGMESTGGGNFRYQYTVRNASAATETLTDFWLPTGDTTASNYTFMFTPGFTATVGPFTETFQYASGIKTPHGQPFPTPPGLNTLCQGEVHWQGSASVPSGGTVTFGFNHPFPSWDVEWGTRSTSGYSNHTATDTIAGPLGTYRNGPVHAPIDVDHIPPLDHFKVYQIDPVSATHSVSLEDQFDQAMGIVEDGTLLQIDYFANPVDKNNEGIADPNAHLVWYRFFSTEPPVFRNVAVANQFGTDTLRIGPPEYLLVPAEKIESGSAFPDSLDHFKVYPVITGDAVNTSVTLKDQFGTESVEVKRPLYFCNPVSKNGEGIINGLNHLVFYKISPGIGYGIPIDVQDQFGFRPLYVDSSAWLGVPTDKLGWEIPDLDHFKVYRVNPVAENQTVTLEDQFDEAMGIVENGALEGIEYFANPVDKNNEGIVDPNAHLVWYRFFSTEPPVFRNVAVSNQFGTDTLRIGPPEYLLVPSEKVEAGSAFPDSLDHFKVYPVITGDPVNTSVTLEDQFGTEGVEVKRPLYFCNPVSKNGEGIIHGLSHLVFYQISPGTEYGIPIDVQNQFGRRSLYADSSAWLGVPTEKLSWEIPGLDHFKVYEVDRTNLMTLPVTLEDQFDQAMGIVESDTLVQIQYFANPVNKNNEGIEDPSAHLVWYRFVSDEPPVCRYVEVSNQFGTDTLQIGSPEYLLVPSQKVEPGSRFPAGLDHFKVYPVISGDPINTSVTLEDQFGAENVEVKRPLYFCNPVSKNGEGIISEVDHLVFYQISPGTEYGISINVLNQFGPRPLFVGSSVWLGVPSEKVSWMVTTDVPGEGRQYGSVLFQNTPNPFSSTTRIAFSMERAEHVHLQVFDVMGRLVRTLVDGVRQPGRHEEQWDGRDQRGQPVASGTYFYRLQTPGWSEVKKMTLTR